MRSPTHRVSPPRPEPTQKTASSLLCCSKIRRSASEMRVMPTLKTMQLQTKIKMMLQQYQIRMKTQAYLIILDSCLPQALAAGPSKKAQAECRRRDHIKRSSRLKGGVRCFWIPLRRTWRTKVTLLQTFKIKAKRSQNPKCRPVSKLAIKTMKQTRQQSKTTKTIKHW